MERTPDAHSCLWCSAPFRRRRLIGRKPQYCTRSCRQRAYEHRRRGARPPERFTHGHTLRTQRPPRYEQGTNIRCRHALRPIGLADWRGYRETLCGARAKPSFPVMFGEGGSGPPLCRTCQRIGRQHPPRSRPDHALRLPALGVVLERLRLLIDDEQTGRPSAALGAVMQELLAYEPR